MKNEKLSNEQISGLCMELSLLLHAGRIGLKWVCS